MGIATGDYGVSSPPACTSAWISPPPLCPAQDPLAHRGCVRRVTETQLHYGRTSPLVGNCSPPIQTSKGSDLLLPMAKARWRLRHFGGTGADCEAYECYRVRGRRADHASA